MINRAIASKIQAQLHKSKAILLMGARQTGKTTLCRYITESRRDYLWLNADEPDVVALFEHASSSRFRNLFGGKSLVIIDEAQRIKDIGIRLKLITDEIPDVQLIVTGSSSFDLANMINEPLTGRKWECQLFPLSYSEMQNHHGIIEEQRLLSSRLVYGYYPEVVMNPGNEKEILKQLSDSYLYKDILMWERIKRPDVLIKLLQALAMQIGSEVSYNNLAKLLSIDKKTVEKYIQLLEQSYIIFRLSGFSRDLRKELKLAKKIYFYDNGIRNALLASFAPPELRTDIGMLWENFVVSERMKFKHYNGIWANSYFWRTHDQQEIDYLEERDGMLHAFEIKWNPKEKAKLPIAFSKTYPNHSFQIVNRDNIQEFI